MERTPAERIATVTPDTADLVGHRVANEDIQSAVVREAIDVWSAKKGARRYPSRDALTPRDMMRFLRHVTLYRLKDGGTDFEYRVMGDAVVQAWGRSFVGCDSAKLNRIRAGMGDVIQRICASIARRGEPLVVRGVLSKGEYEHIDQETVFLPLGPDDTTIDHVLSVSWYAPKPPGPIARPRAPSE